MNATQRVLIASCPISDYLVWQLETGIEPLFDLGAAVPISKVGDWLLAHKRYDDATRAFHLVLDLISRAHVDQDRGLLFFASFVGLGESCEQLGKIDDAKHYCREAHAFLPWVTAPEEQARLSALDQRLEGRH